MVPSFYRYDCVPPTGKSYGGGFSVYKGGTDSHDFSIYIMATICPDCVTGNRLSGTPKGVEIKLFALPAYFASPTGENGSHTKKALVISPDVFGFGINSPKLLADIFAEKCGIDVWVADTFKGIYVINYSENPKLTFCMCGQVTLQSVKRIWHRI